MDMDQVVDGLVEVVKKAPQAAEEVRRVWDAIAEDNDEVTGEHTDAMEKVLGEAKTAMEQGSSTQGRPASSQAPAAPEAGAVSGARTRTTTRPPE